MTSVLSRRTFLGVDFTPLSCDEAAQRIAERPAGASFVYVVTPNAQYVVANHGSDRRFAGPMAAAWMRLNDSCILRILARRLFGFDLPLAAGSDLTARLFEIGVRPDTPITIIGGDAEVEARLRTQFGLTRIARLTPSMGFWRDPVEVAACVEFVRRRPAAFVFFVVGAPQSDLLALKVLEAGGATGVGLCVGSSLNFLTGVTRRAPALVRRASLEWAWRLGQNPVGHFRRVFAQSAPVLWIALRERLRPPSAA